MTPKTFVVLFLHFALWTVTEAEQCPIELPQNVPSESDCYKERQEDLQKKQATYRLKTSELVPPFPMLDMSPQQLFAVVMSDPFMMSYTLPFVKMSKVNEEIFGKYVNQTEGLPISDMKDYEEMRKFFRAAPQPILGDTVKLPSEHEDFQNDFTKWIEDDMFAQQRLAGVNPHSLQRVTEHKDGQDAIGIDWNKLREELNPSFDVNKALKERTGGKLTLKRALKGGYLYAFRFPLADDLESVPDITEDDPRRTRWDWSSPIALFYTDKRAKAGIRPLAIQMDYTPDSSIFTPKDGDNWLFAKLNLQVTDLAVSQIEEHLVKIHILMEPVCVGVKRHFPVQHPLQELLKFHCREIIVPNTFGIQTLVGENEFAHELFAYGHLGALAIIRKLYPLSWDVTDFRKNLKTRGMNEKKSIPYYPFRSDGKEILRVIERAVNDYVDLYYDDDEDVQNDVELQAFANEVSADGTGSDGGKGKIKDFPSKLSTREELKELLVRIIWQLTGQHAPVNYEMIDYASYVPNLPTKLYNDSRVEPGKFSYLNLPNRYTSSVQCTMTDSLSTFRFDKLFDYGGSLQDEKAGDVIEFHYSKLSGKIERKLKKRNKNRLEYGRLTFPYFLPSWLPNGVQT